MFNLGVVELVVLGIIVLLVIGPKQIPGAARAVARLLNQLRSTTNEIKKSFLDTQQEAEKQISDLQNQVSENLKVSPKDLEIYKKMEEIKEDIVGSTQLKSIDEESGDNS